MPDAFDFVNDQVAVLPDGQAIIYGELAPDDPIRLAAERQYTATFGGAPPPQPERQRLEDVFATPTAGPDISGLPSPTPTRHVDAMTGTAPVTAVPAPAVPPAPLALPTTSAPPASGAPAAAPAPSAAVAPPAPPAPSFIVTRGPVPAPARETPRTRIERAYAERENLMREQAARGAEVQRAEADIRGNLEKDYLEARQRSQAAMEDAGRRAAQAREAMAQARRRHETARIDPDRYWHNRGTGGRILMAIAMGADVFGAGLRGGSPVLLPMVQQAIEDDIQSQIADRNAMAEEAGLAQNELAAYERAMGDAAQGERAARVAATERAENMIAQNASAIFGADAGAASVAGAIGALRTEREQLLAKIDAHAGGRAMSEYQRESARARFLEIAIAKERQALAARRENRLDDALALQRDAQSARENANALAAGRAERAEVRTGQRNLESDVQNIATIWERENLAAMMPAAREVEDIMHEFEGEMPSGIGVTAQAFRALPLGNQIARTLQSSEAARVRGAIANLANQILRAQSGAAVTDPEFKRFLEAVAGQQALSLAEYENGIPRMLDQVRSARAMAAAAGSPEALQLFEQRYEQYRSAPLGGRLTDTEPSPSRRRARGGPARVRESSAGAARLAPETMPAPEAAPAPESPEGFPPGFEE